MKWAELVAQKLAPSFGGFPTFCFDPDDLLEEPAVRDALAGRGVTLAEWSGNVDELEQWHVVDDACKPIIKIASGARLHLLDERLSEAARLDVGVSAIFPKLDPEVVRAVSRAHWDSLLRLHDAERPLRTRRESALMVARLVFGIDFIYVGAHGWDRAIAQVAVCAEPVPQLIAAELLRAIDGPCDPDVEAALTDVAAARAFSREEKVETTDPIAKVLTTQGIREHKRRSTAYGENSLLSNWHGESLSATRVQELAIAYATAVANGVSYEVRTECNKAFGIWLRSFYDLMLSSHNPDVIRMHKLIDTFDTRLGSDRGVLIVIDALSLEAWLGLRKSWMSRNIITGANEESGFAIIPTLTSWSRRAMFEGKLPPQFDSNDHSQSLERRLWQKRFPNGAYFNVAEELAFREAIYQGVPRLAVLDVSWDKRGHAIDPEIDSISDQAALWATKKGVSELVREAMTNGYRVFVTADHGQAPGRGIGVPNIGEVPEERSKRVLTFASESTRDTHAAFGDTDFLPITVPKTVSPLFARYGESFDVRNATSFSHGGLSIEEVMIPFVELSV